MDQHQCGAGGKATPQIAVNPIIENYLGQGLLAKENANMSHLSPAGLLLVLGEEALKKNYLHCIREAGYNDLANWHEQGYVHIHDLGLGVKTPYCSGHSLENLLHDGISAGNIISGPAKRLCSAVNHIINHIGACSNEFAGAQAFNDVDLFLGPYALDFFLSRVNTYKMPAEQAMKMTLEEVDQSMQEMIFHLNYNTRYGGQCVDEATQCLTPEGWKTHKEINVGDVIYVFDMTTQRVKTDIVKHVNRFNCDGHINMFVLHDGGLMYLTDQHRVVYGTSPDPREPFVMGTVDDIKDTTRKPYVPAITVHRKRGEFVATDSGDAYVEHWQRIPYTGLVWCPSTDTGTFIARRSGTHAFVTGNSPFSNISLALSVPSDMETRRPLIGGKTLEDRWGSEIFECSCAGDHITYGDLEMWQNIVAEAILNNFLRGDSRGTGFTFPVLTVSVTPEFFDHPLKKKVFELSAKFGNPYFQNYINGHSAGKKIEPADVRSMCPLHGNTLARQVGKPDNVRTIGRDKNHGRHLPGCLGKIKTLIPLTAVKQAGQHIGPSLQHGLLRILKRHIHQADLKVVLFGNPPDQVQAHALALTLLIGKFKGGVGGLTHKHDRLVVQEPGPFARAQLLGFDLPEIEQGHGYCDSAENKKSLAEPLRRTR